MIKAIITDFDGTLVDTYKANFCAYRESFRILNVPFLESDYKRFFGLRFDDFMKGMNITDVAVINKIKELKREIYPNFFSEMRLNLALFELMNTCRTRGNKIAIASTARKENLLNVLRYFDMTNSFDLIFAGDDVKYGKPNPEIYVKTMSLLKVHPNETLIFEDSIVGVEAAKSSGAFCMQISL